jgi:ubiquinone biosynthesis protein
MNEQIGWRGLLRAVRQEAPFWAAALPQLPRLVHRALSEDRLGGLHDTLKRLADESARRNDLLSAALVILSAALIVAAVALL